MLTLLLGKPVEDIELGSGLHGIWRRPHYDLESALSSNPSSTISSGIAAPNGGAIAFGAIKSILHVSQPISSAITTAPVYGALPIESALKTPDDTYAYAAIDGKNSADSPGAIYGLEPAISGERDSAISGKNGDTTSAAIEGKAGDWLPAAIRGSATTPLSMDSGINVKGGNSVDSALLVKGGLTVETFFIGYQDIELDGPWAGINSRPAFGFSSALFGNIASEVGGALWTYTNTEVKGAMWGVLRNVAAAQTYSALQGYITVSQDRDSALFTSQNTACYAATLGRNGTSFGAALAGESSPESAYYDFNIKNMVEVTSYTEQSDLYTVVKVLYAYDHSKLQHSKSLTLEAPDAIKLMGTITKEIDARWVQTPRQAYELGVRYLKYYARTRWTTVFKTDLHAIETVPGVWVTVDHPLVPKKGRTLILSHEIDFNTGVISIGFETLVGAVPRVLLSRMSSMFDPVADGITVNYANGKATLRVITETGAPLIGAVIELDGTTKRTTDNQGQAYFDAERGSHHIKITAAGYVPIEADVTF